MGIQIENRSTRWGSVGRLLTVPTKAELRQQITVVREARQHPVRPLRPVLQKRRHHASSAQINLDSTGPARSNLRPGQSGEARTPAVGSGLEAKD